MEDVKTYLEQARQATGLDDFGDGGFLEGLERLVHSGRTEARLNLTGEQALGGLIVMLLCQRLRIEDCYARHPEIDEERIENPLFILGLPRTGSTALHCLLGEDTEARVIRNWEGLNPTPPPERATYENDPRIVTMQAFMDAQDEVLPRMKQMLPSTATSPIEDQFQMGYDFKSQIFQAQYRLPGYVRWLNEQADLVPTFEYVKRVLKLLQWRCPPTRWRLKNPGYTLFIDALDTVFPDARYCMTHRDVGDVLPSVADLYAEMSRPNTDHLDKHEIGAICGDWCELGMRRMIAFRDRGHEHRFHDVHFAPFQKDPIPVIAGLYAFLGETFTEQTRDRMLAWRASTPRDKHGNHEYRATDFGLDPQQLRARFNFYADRFTA